MPQLPGNPKGLANLQCQYLNEDYTPVDEDNLPFTNGLDSCREEIIPKYEAMKGRFLAKFSCPEK